MSTVRFFLAACACLATAQPELVAAAEGPRCRAVLDARAPYVLKQRVPVEIHGYVSTGDFERFDRSDPAGPGQEPAVKLRWLPEDNVFPDPERLGRAFIRPGYRQETFNVRLQAWYHGERCDDSAEVAVHVDVDYTQFLEVQFGGTAGSAGSAPTASASVRLVDEMTQLSTPIFLSVAAERRIVENAARLDVSDVEERIALKLLDPRLYAGFGHLHRSARPGTSLHGYGFGFERLPDIDRLFSIGVSAWSYQLNGNAVRTPARGRGAAAPFSVHLLLYEVSATRLFPSNRAFVHGGIRWSHEAGPALRNAALEEVRPTLGVGWRL